MRGMPDERLPKSIFHGELSVGHRSRGRPKLRFKDVIKQDMNVFNINPGRPSSLAVCADRGLHQLLHRKTAC